MPKTLSIPLNHYPVKLSSPDAILEILNIVYLFIIRNYENKLKFDFVQIKLQTQIFNIQNQIIFLNKIFEY